MRVGGQRSSAVPPACPALLSFPACQGRAPPQLLLPRGCPGGAVIRRGTSAAVPKAPAHKGGERGPQKGTRPGDARPPAGLEPQPLPRKMSATA